MALATAVPSIMRGSLESGFIALLGSRSLAQAHGMFDGCPSGRFPVVLHVSASHGLPPQRTETERPIPPRIADTVGESPRRLALPPASGPRTRPERRLW